jgi:hypothetical protein
VTKYYKSAVHVGGDSDKSDQTHIWPGDIYKENKYYSLSDLSRI